MSSRRSGPPVTNDLASTETPALVAQDLIKDYVVRDAFLRERHIRAVDGVSFSVKTAETLAIVGESGCGKSTLGRLLLRLVDVTSGTIELLGTKVEKLTQKEFRKHRSRIQMVFQDPFASFDPRMRVGESIREVATRSEEYSAKGPNQVVESLIESVGLDPILARRFPSQLSGGELQRLSIARALATRPDVIFLDEPTSALDVAVRGQIVNLLMDHQLRTGLTYVLVAHDLRIVLFMASQVAVMYLGELVEVASKDELFSRPLHPYTRGLFGAAEMSPKGLPIVRLVGELQQDHADLQGCRLIPRCPYAQPDCAQPQVMQDVGFGHFVRCWRALDPELSD